MPEVGSYHERFDKFSADDEEESDGPKEGLKDAVTLIKNQCAHVYSEPENGEMLDDLIKDAQEFYSADESGWDKLLNNTRKKLANEEDPSMIEDILRSAITEGTELMD